MFEIFPAIAGVLLSILWIISFVLKKRNFEEFKDDLSSFLPPGLITFLAIGTLAFEIGLAILCVVPLTRQAGAYLSIAFILLLSASFIPRALHTRSLDCSCFGRKEREYDFVSKSLRQEIQVAWNPASLWGRNGGMIVLGSLAAGSSILHAAVAATAVFALIAIAGVLSVGRMLGDVRREQHPASWRLRNDRRIIFATVWHAGLSNGWLSCLDTDRRGMVDNSCRDESPALHSPIPISEVLK